MHVRVVAGETLILDRHQQLIHQLNQTASYIWDRCDGTATVAAIADQLAQAFDVEPTRAAQDVAALVCQLQQVGLLEPYEADLGSARSSSGSSLWNAAESLALGQGDVSNG